MGSLDFNQFPQPDSNDRSSVVNALAALRNAHDQPSARHAYDGILYAVGNNHAGTFYPVVLAILPEIEQILKDGNGGPGIQQSKH